MYINQKSLEYKHFQDFEKYARFICEKFDIEIVLDSSRAETDGKTIFLPNVMSMTSQELNMMYAILLHEAGHIRYSTFDEKYFSSLKSEAHAFLANSIEDARIENLLLKDFGGAQEIFENLYCNYVNNKKLMKKVFKHKGEKPDVFTTLAFYIHNKIVNFETANLKSIAGSYRANRVLKFWRESNIDDLIAETPLKGDKEVLELTNQIYDLFVKKFADKSEKIDFKKTIEEKNKMKKKMDSLKKEGLAIEEEVKEFQEKLQDIEKKIDDFDKIHPEKFELEKAIAKSQEKIQDLQNQMDWKNQYDSNLKKMANLEQSINKNQEDLPKLEQVKQQLEAKLQDGVKGRNQKPMTEEQKEDLKNKIETKKSQIEKNHQKLETMKNQLKEIKQAVEKAEEQSQLNSLKYDKDMNIEEKKTQQKTENEEKTEKQKEIDILNKEKAELIGEFNSTMVSMEKIQSNFMEKVASEMISIDKASQGGDIEMDILPDLNYEDVWPEAAAAQESFDKKATKSTGKMVRNGEKAVGLFGSNVRDILVYIDKTKEKIEEIDIVELFKGKINSSKLSDFNSNQKEKNHMEDQSVVGVFGTYREHIPLTTIFDSFKKETVGDEQEMKLMQKKNYKFYQDLKNVFMKKFKFAKKDFWRGGKEDGELDARNLWKLPTNQGDDYFEINQKKPMNKSAATILVDLSGSQNKEVTEYGEKIKELVLGLSMALSEVHIKHEVLGFHAPICEEMRAIESSHIYTRRSNKLETILYKDSQQKSNSGIMNIELKMSDNSDGESLRIAMKRLKMIQAKSNLLFIVSDGKPFLSDTDMSVLDEDFRSALRQAVKEKIQVFGLGFFNSLEHFLGNRFCNTTNEKDILDFFLKTNFL